MTVEADYFAEKRSHRWMKPLAKLALLLIAVILGTTSAAAFSIEPQNKIKISETKSLLGKAPFFCVTEDELFIIPDSGTADVKIYSKSGKFLELTKTLGKKGYGPGEFIEPLCCCYDKNEKKLAIMDFGQRKVFIYARTGKNEFIRVNQVFCLTLGYSIRLNKNRLFVSGFKTSNDLRPFALYDIDLGNNKTSFLLPAYYKYGLQSFHDYETQYRQKPDIKTIGLSGWFDIGGKNIYFAWEGDLKIIELNLDTQEIRFFGEKTPYYIKPFASKKLIESYRKGDLKNMKREWAGMSFVRNVFAGREYVLLIYEGPRQQDRESNCRAQFYSLNGKFLAEVAIPGKSDGGMCLDKDRDILYSLSSEVDGDREEYYIWEYKISK